MSLKKIFIVEDHPIMREVLGDLIKNETGLELCGSAATGEEALQYLAEVTADVVLVDLALPGMNSFELVQALQERQPPLPCLMLSGHSEVNYIRSALKVGARGYVLKGHPPDILAAIHAVIDGGTFLSPAVQAKLAGAGG